MTKNESLLLRWGDDPRFTKEVNARVAALRRGYPSRHHGRWPDAAVIAAWRFDEGLKVARTLQADADARAKAEWDAAVKEAAAARAAEEARIRAIPENAAYHRAYREEHKVWRRVRHVLNAGETPSRELLATLLKSAEALVATAKARADAGLDPSYCREVEFGNVRLFNNPDLSWAQDHLDSARELMRMSMSMS